MKVVLGSTGIISAKNGFGALPIQRVEKDRAVTILRKAFDGGINFYDTARFYTDSEEKLGLAFKSLRGSVTIASKTMAQTKEDFWADLETSLKNLETDYLDIYQLHNPAYCPEPGDEAGLYDAMLEAKRKGMIRHIGISNHRLDVAEKAVESGLYETLQFPLSYLSSPKEIMLAEKCAEKNMGFIAMKAMAGGLINNAAAAFSFLSLFPNVLPIWGIQRESELEQFLDCEKNRPIYDNATIDFIEKEKSDLSSNFCRGCGYCMPCPVDIEINNCARMSLLIRRSPSASQLTPAAREKMKKIEDCIHCGECSSKCPYGLDTPSLLEANYEDYKNIVNGKTTVGVEPA
ncbi:MAG: aldo/keto reductase [Bacteroidales bacterium]|jgi:predicted aldo/keto reductase-like oxidoreductase